MLFPLDFSFISYLIPKGKYIGVSSDTGATIWRRGSCGEGAAAGASPRDCARPLPHAPHCHHCPQHSGGVLLLMHPSCKDLTAFKALAAASAGIVGEVEGSRKKVPATLL